MERKDAQPKSGSQINDSYPHDNTEIELEEELMHTTSTCTEIEVGLQNDIVQMRKTLDQEICLRNTREQELREKETIVEELKKSLSVEKHARARLEKESSVVRNACSELEERLNKLHAQMRQALGNKRRFWGSDTKGNQLREKERTLDELNKKIEQEKQARRRVEEELNQSSTNCEEQEERLKNELTKMQQTLENEIFLRSTVEEELRGKKTTIDELQKTLSEEQLARARVEEALSQKKTVCNDLEKKLENELEQMQSTLEKERCFRFEREQELREMGIVLDELQRRFEEQQLIRTKVEEELNQVRADRNELKEKLGNELAQMQRMLENEICLRSTREQQLKQKAATADELEKTLGEEQLARTILEKELNQARSDCVEQRERLKNELEQTQRTLNIEKRLLNTKEKQLREKDSFIDELQERLSGEEQTRTRVEEELSQARTACNEAVERLRNHLARMHDYESSLRIAKEQELSEKETIINEQRRALAEQQRASEDKLNLTRNNYSVQIETKDTTLRERQRLLEEERQQKTALEGRLRSLQLQMEEERNRHTATERELESALSAAQEALAGYQRHRPRDWIIQREEVVLSENVLGRGAWGYVCEGTFRSCQVAVKEIHELILSDHNRRLFEREMRIASCCRHPNLLQFIGATNDDGNPLFVTELLDTSLRHLLSHDQRTLSQEEILNLALDVAKGLNYLHLNRPLPIIHRDISSANVLLWRRNECWRAKLSDFGSANFQRQCTTVNPGAIIYSAPEALTLNAQQSTKVDVYSFGVLLCEMCIRELPSRQEVRNQIGQVTNGALRRLIKRCVKERPENRPTMSELISELEELTRATGLLSRVRPLFR